MSDPDLQVQIAAATVYENFFVPALFQEWAARMVDAAHIQPGQRVLDVACGTGILARKAASRVGPTGFVAGLDLNPGMLSVAARIAPIRSMIDADLTGWLPLMGIGLTEEQVHRILAEAETALSAYVTPAGAVFDSPAHIVTMTKQ